MGDLDDISCKTFPQVKIVVLKASCCYTNSVKRKKTKQRVLILIIFTSTQRMCQ